MFKIITIPFDRKNGHFDEDILNRFVINKEIKAYRAEFFQDGDAKYWTIFLEYDPLLEQASKKDLEGLNEPQRLLLDRLKAWRKERAEKDGVPVFIIGANRELVDIVRNAPKSLEALRQIKGFGKSKISRYGTEIIGIINGFYSKQ
ncbi:HRDC domain-containing protein [bacterium]|nr:HRDC domain-containing protein [bacterium]